MAKIDLGRIMPRFLGEWSGVARYEPLDVVYYSLDGSSYVAIQKSTNKKPTETAYWTKVAQGADSTTDVSRVLDAIKAAGTLNINSIETTSLTVNGSDIASVIQTQQQQIVALNEELAAQKQLVNELDDTVREHSDYIVNLLERVEALESK